MQTFKKEGKMMFNVRLDGVQFYNKNNKDYSFEHTMEFIPIQINIDSGNDKEEKYCILERGYSTNEDGDEGSCVY